MKSNAREKKFFWILLTKIESIYKSTSQTFFISSFSKTDMTKRQFNSETIQKQFNKDNYRELPLGM